MEINNPTTFYPIYKNIMSHLGDLDKLRYLSFVDIEFGVFDKMVYNKINFDVVVKDKNLDDAVIYDYIDPIVSRFDYNQWWRASKFMKLTPEILMKYCNEVNKRTEIQQNLNIRAEDLHLLNFRGHCPTFHEILHERVNYFSFYEPMTKAEFREILRKNYKHLTEESGWATQPWEDFWYGISKYQVLSEECIAHFSEKVSWYAISKYQKLSEGFMKKFHNKVYWRHIAKYQTLSEKFIWEYKAKLDFSLIAKHQKLSVAFIERMYDFRIARLTTIIQWEGCNSSSLWAQKIAKSNKAFWTNISKHQFLSEEFMLINIDNLNWDHLKKYQKSGKTVLNKFLKMFEETEETEEINVSPERC